MKKPVPKPKQLVEDKRRRQTIKCLRKKSLAKKCIELSKLCNLKINLVIYNEEFNALQQYSSHADFTINEISQKVKDKTLVKVSPTVTQNQQKGRKKCNFIEDLPMDLHLMNQQQAYEDKQENYDFKIPHGTRHVFNK